MEVITKNEFLEKKRKYLERMREEVFIYPTDTIYGIGCDATNVEAVRKIRIIKKRFESPFSIIVPNKKWIFDNCEVNAEAEIQLNKLPGPYTIILPLKNRDAVSEDVDLSTNTIGIRMPDHWIQEVVRSLEVPIVTTSANEHGKDFLTDIENITDHLRKSVDFAIDIGPIEGKPSTIIKVLDDKPEIIRN